MKARNVCLSTALFVAACTAGSIENGPGFSTSGLPAEDPFAVPPQCTSGVVLDPNQQEGEGMNPGHSCLACHQEKNATLGADAPIFAFAGSVFPTGHEPNDCRAPASAGAMIIVTDAAGTVHKAIVNEVGNFMAEEGATLELPYTAKVVFEGRESAMLMAPMDGDCNGCHTQSGASDALGRILLP